MAAFRDRIRLAKKKPSVKSTASPFFPSELNRRQLALHSLALFFFSEVGVKSNASAANPSGNFVINKIFLLVALTLVTQKSIYALLQSALRGRRRAVLRASSSRALPKAGQREKRKTKKVLHSKKYKVRRIAKQ